MSASLPTLPQTQDKRRATSMSVYKETVMSPSPPKQTSEPDLKPRSSSITSYSKEKQDFIPISSELSSSPSHHSGDEIRRIRELEAQVQMLLHENRTLKDEKEKLVVKLDTTKESTKTLVDAVED